VSQVIITWQEVTVSHHMMSHYGSYDKCGKVVHRPCSSCISSVEKSNGNSIEFFLSIAKQRAVGFILAWSLAFLHPAYKDICQYNLCSPSLLFSLFSLSLNKEERQNHLLGRKFPDLFLTHLSDSLDSGSNDPDHTWGQSQSVIKDIKASCYFEPFE